MCGIHFVGLARGRAWGGGEGGIYACDGKGGGVKLRVNSTRDERVFEIMIMIVIVIWDVNDVCVSVCSALRSRF